MAKTNILIAEDDPVLRELYMRKFAQSGYDIRTAENGETAVQMIREKVPDIMICDIMMPTRDGWWVLEQFPKGQRAFPIIMLTNLYDDETRMKSTKFADGYFVKMGTTLASLVDMTNALISNTKKK